MTFILTVLLKSAPQAARYICYFALQILNKEAVDKVRGEREIPDVQPGCILQMRLVKHLHPQFTGILSARSFLPF